MHLGLAVALAVGPVVSVTMAVIGRAGASGRIRRNHAVGIRLPSTMASDAAWAAGHRAAVAPAWWSLAVLVAADVVAVLLETRGLPVEGLTIGLVVVVVLAIAWITVGSDRAARAVAAGR